MSHVDSIYDRRHYGVRRIEDNCLGLCHICHVPLSTVLRRWGIAQYGGQHSLRQWAAHGEFSVHPRVVGVSVIFQVVLDEHGTNWHAADCEQ